MSKSLLIIHTPIHCGECACHVLGHEGFRYCCLSGHRLDDKDYCTKRLDNCPLKLMPNKKIVKEIRSMNDIVGYSINQLGDIFTAHVELQTETLLSLGYNKCIDDL